MSTPLTDSINALTTYANEVTGASDTTLSDAVHTLASGYGQGGGSTDNTLEYVIGASGTTPIDEVIWHGGGTIVNSCFSGLFGQGNKNIPISFPDHPTGVAASAFNNSKLKVDWDSLGAELLAAGNNAFRISYQDDCSSQVVRFPKFDGLTHDGMTGQSCFAYQSAKAPGTYYFDTIQNIPREMFTNLTHGNFSATFGSVGHAVQSSGMYPFHNSSAATVATVTTYTTGAYLDAVRANLENAIGSDTFTFVYKASEATTYGGDSYAAGATMLTA